MASVTFGVLMLGLATDPTTEQAFSLHTLEMDPTVNVSNRQYAGGNSRSVRSKGKQRHAKVVTNFLTPTQVTQLKAWQGLTLSFRTPDSEKLYGNFTDPSFVPLPAGITGFSFTFDETTLSEAV